MSITVWRSNLCVRVVWLFLLSLCFVQSVSSFESNTESFLSLSLESLLKVKITTASRISEEAIDAPAKVVVITRKQIKERGYINLFDLLKAQAGIDAHGYSQETTYNRIAVRGVEGNSKFIIQLDGVPISAPAGDPIPVADNFPLFNAERVEIVFGPASALYGADAFTGVVNIVTSSVSDNSVEIGSYLGEDHYQYYYGSGNYRINERLRLSFSGHYHESDNPDLSNSFSEIFELNDLVDFSGNPVVVAGDRVGYNADTDSQSLSLKMEYDGSLTIGYHQSKFELPTTTGLLPNTVDYGAKSKWSSFLSTLYSQYEFEIDDKIELFTRVAYSYYEVDESSKFNNLFSNFEDGFKYADADKIQVEGVTRYEPNEEHQLLFGVMLDKINALAKTADLPVSYEPDRTRSEQSLYYVGTNNSLPVKTFDTSYQNMGAFIQHRYSWNDDLDSIFGVRYDDNSRYGSSLNPRVGLVYRGSERVTFKLLYGEAFLAPAPEFTFEHFGAFDGEVNAQGLYVSSFFFIPNPELEPEELSTFEANMSIVFNQDFVIDLSAYYSTVDKIILNSTTGEPISDFIEGGVILATSTNANIGDQETYGIDLDMSHRWVFENSEILLWGNVSYVDGELEDTVRNIPVDLPFVSKNKAKLGMTYNYNDRYHLSPFIYWIGDASTDVVNLIGTVPELQSSRGYTVVDLNAGIEDLLPGLSISLKVSNLLDRRYYNPGTGVNITFSESPQNPRQVFLGFKYEFGSKF